MPSLPTRDKVGNRRIFGNQVDIGAYEQGSSPQSAPYKLVFSSSEQTIFVDQNSQKITIQLQGQDDSLVDAVDDLIVDLGSSSSTGVFSVQAGAAAVTSVTIFSGDNEAGFYYRDAVDGSINLMVTANIEDSQKSTAQTIIVGSLASKIEINAPSGIYLGQDIILDIETQNDSGMITPSPDNLTITLTTTSGTLDPATLTLAAGETDGQVTLAGSTIGVVTVTASNDTLADKNLDITVNNTVSSVSVADSPAKAGDTVTITAVGQPEQIATFDISGIAADIAMIESLTVAGTYTGVQTLSSSELADGEYDVIVTIGAGSESAVLIFDGPLANIPDSGLREALESTFGKEPGDSITEIELETLTTLTATNRTISDLTGLESCSNLTSLDLTGSSLSYEIYSTQIPILENRGITVTFTIPSDRVFIPDTNLQVQLTTALSLNQNQLIPISSLNSPEFTYFRATPQNNNQKIEDLTGLEYCGNLTELDLTYNNISNISILNQLTKISTLSLDSNNIADISPLDSLERLENVHLSQNQIKDIQPLISNPNIAGGDLVVLTDNPLTNFSYTHLISQLTNRGVTVEVNAVVNAIVFKDSNLEDQVRSALGNITTILTASNTSNLITLEAKQAQITDLTGLQELTNLTSLDISFNPLSRRPCSGNS